MTTPPPPDRDTITASFSALRIKQPIGDIYVAKIDADLIQRITYFDVRRVLRDERDVERYLGIQRPLNEKRVRELQDYVNFIDATFPTSIILAVDADYASYDEDEMKMTITNTREGDDEPTTAFRNLCRVIDGQHRIAGLEGFTGENFEVLVSMFVGSDIADQAYVFATVNLEQTKVNKSLAYDLFELARTRSPFKTCHNIAVALDQSEGSPFHHRIKRLGGATPGRARETLTQATFVNALVPYISENPKLDRDDLLRGRALRPAAPGEERKLCFRNLFIRDEDVKIGKIIEQYFLAVRSRWPRAWDVGGEGLILNRTNGFRALMKMFGPIYIDLAHPGDFVEQERFLEIFRRVDVSDDYFSVENFLPGTSGESELRRFFERSIFG